MAFCGAFEATGLSSSYPKIAFGMKDGNNIAVYATAILCTSFLLVQL